MSRPACPWNDGHAKQSCRLEKRKRVAAISDRPTSSRCEGKHGGEKIKEPRQQGLTSHSRLFGVLYSAATDRKVKMATGCRQNASCRCEASTLRADICRLADNAYSATDSRPSTNPALLVSPDFLEIENASSNVLRFGWPR